MIKKTLTAIGTTLLIVSLSCSFITAQENPQDQQAMMEAYMKMMAPNENHEYLKNFVGDWDVTTTSWMMPGAEPSVSTGTSKAELILEGRFLKMDSRGTMFGQPFEGLQIVGYDTLQKKFITFWIDNSSTAFYLMSGTPGETEKVRTETGDWPDPMTGGTIKVRDVTTLVDEDEFNFEMYMPAPDGTEFKSMEYRFTHKTAEHNELLQIFYLFADRIFGYNKKTFKEGEEL